MRNQSLITICMMFLVTSLLAVAAFDYDKAPTEDAYVDQVRPDNTFNTTVLQARGYDGGYDPFGGVDSVQRTFLKFDLSTIAEDPTIESAVFGIYLNGWSESSTPSLQLSHIGDGWNEDDVTWNNSSSLVANASFIGNGEQIDDPRYYEWDVLTSWDAGDITDGFVSYMLTVEHEDITNHAYFNSRENAVFQPYLRINYIPEPATLAMLSFGGLALLRKRK